MNTRIHSETSFIKIVVNLLLFLFLLDAKQILAGQSVGNDAKTPAGIADIIRDPADVPPPVANRAPTTVRVTLIAKEVLGLLDPGAGTQYRYWTFNGKVPGPMIRARQGDTIEVTLHNDAGSHMVHSVDFHAALGPGGGAALSQTIPGQSKTFTFQATTPGLFVYHCGTPMIAEHMANGMYGLILVEPAEGLPHVDHEYYVMQGEVYTAAPKGKPGLQQFSGVKLMAETPEYYVFNGAVDALMKGHPMHAEVGQTVRFFFGNAGPNGTSSMHVVGEIFTHDYSLGSLTSPPLTGVQTATVPPGGAAILEVTTNQPGKFVLMDHAIARMEQGLMAALEVTGTDNQALMHAGPATSQSGQTESAAWVSGMTPADTQAAERAQETGTASTEPQIVAVNEKAEAVADPMDTMPTHDMSVHMTFKRVRPLRPSDSRLPLSTSRQAVQGPTELNGCLTLLEDGKAMLKVFPSNKTYRVEGQPLLFSEKANHLIHVTGERGSVVAKEDPNIPSFVVSTVDELAPDCSIRITPALLRKALSKDPWAGAPAPLTVGMNGFSFVPPKTVIKAGQKVTWKDSSDAIHDVVDDAGKAVNSADVHVPHGVKPFDSGWIQPGQTFSHTFTTPGVYQYACTLHEGYGMKGTVVVK